MLNVNKSITLNGTSSVEENGVATDIMYMNATISENGLSINRNIANAQAYIANKATYTKDSICLNGSWHICIDYVSSNCNHPLWLLFQSKSLLSIPIYLNLWHFIFVFSNYFLIVFYDIFYNYILV